MIGFLNFKKAFKKEVDEEKTETFAPIRVAVASSNDAFLAYDTIINKLKKNTFLEILPETETFDVSFLNPDNKNFFDFWDTGLKILKKQEADILLWVDVKDNKVRFNIQTSDMYQWNTPPFFSLLNALYLPLSYFNGGVIPNQILTLLTGAIIAPCVEKSIEYKRILEQISDVLNKTKMPEGLNISFRPYLLSWLASVYICLKSENFQKKDLAAVLNIVSVGLNDGAKEYDPLLTGSLYVCLGQAYQACTHTDAFENYGLIRKAIESYKTAQKYFSRYVFPYDFARLGFVLARLYFKFFSLSDDQQALRDAVYHLRQAEKIFTIASFPFLWAEIEGLLGEYLSVLGNVSENEEILLLAVQHFKNQQKVYKKEYNADVWGDIEIKTGNVYYYLGKKVLGERYLEESITHYTNAFDVFKNSTQNKKCDEIALYINKAEEEIVRFSSI